MKRSFILLIIVFALVACSSEQPSTPANADELTVQLAWIPTIEYASFYLAEADGLYTEQNLDVEFVSGGFDSEGNFVDNIAELRNGNADITLMSADRLLIERANGAPFVAVGTLYQRNPIAFISLAENDINSPQDFIGATVQVDDIGGTTGIVYTAMMTELGIDREQINEVPRADFSNDPLINGDVDVISAFVNNQPVQLELAGYDLNIVLASDYGIELYPNVIVTTEDFLANNRDVVERFVAATSQGLQAAIDDPQHATDVTVAVDATLNPESELLSMQRALPLINIPGRTPGAMTAESWQGIYDILVEQEFIEPLNVTDAYDLSVLDTSN